MESAEADKQAWKRTWSKGIIHYNINTRSYWYSSKWKTYTHKQRCQWYWKLWWLDVGKVRIIYKRWCWGIFAGLLTVLLFFIYHWLEFKKFDSAIGLVGEPGVGNLPVVWAVAGTFKLVGCSWWGSTTFFLTAGTFSGVGIVSPVCWAATISAGTVGVAAAAAVGLRKSPPDCWLVLQRAFAIL